jgi:hypoxanthine phosphoribosyltransferase
MNKTYINWETVFKDINILSNLVRRYNIDAIVGIGRGGLIPATILSYTLDIKVLQNFQIESYEGEKTAGVHKLWQNPENHFISTFYNKNILVVDDLADSGNTLNLVKRFFEHKNVNLFFATLYYKKGTSFMPNACVREYSTDEWIVFPWEETDSACTPCNKQLYFNI